jgi:excisionase family DNA binding protein
VSALALRAEAVAHRALERAHREAAEALERAAREEEDAPATSTPTSAGWQPLKTCGLRRTTARRLARDGVIRSSRVGRELLVNVEDVRHYIEGQRVQRVEARERASGDEFDRALATGGKR